jgi:hypothetical protein
MERAFSTPAVAADAAAVTDAIGRGIEKRDREADRDRARG